MSQANEMTARNGEPREEQADGDPEARIRDLRTALGRAFHDTNEAAVAVIQRNRA